LVTLDPFAPDETFVDRTELLAHVSGLLRGGQSVLLIGGAGSGKTALARHLDFQRLGPGGEAWQLLRTDTQGWDLDSVKTAFGALRGVLEQQDSGTYPESTRKLLHEAALHVAPFTVVIDGADRLLECSWRGTFFGELRYLGETLLRLQVSFLLIGGPDLTEFQTDGPDLQPLFMATTVPMVPLPPEAVQELIDALPAHRRVPRPAVLDLTGGHAGLTTELLRELRAGQPIDAAAASVYTKSSRLFEFWSKQLGADVRRELARMPRQGRVPATARDWELHKLETKARTVGVLFQDEAGRARVPSLFRRWFRRRDPAAHPWDVVVSFAPDDEAEARQLVVELDERYDVFFAPHHELPPGPAGHPPGVPEIRVRCQLVLYTKTYHDRYWQPAWSQRAGLLLFGAAGNGALRRDDDGSLHTLRQAIDRILERSP
jgi:energy-coupling factor transporter ATP-binding protein EcfA2